VTYLERALREPPTPVLRPQLLLELGVLEARLDPVSAIGHLDEAMSCVDQPELRAHTAQGLGRALVLCDRSGDAVHVIERTIERLGAEHRELQLILESDLAGIARLNVGLRPLAVQRLKKYERDLDEDTAAGRALLANLAHEAAMGGEPVDTVADLARRALAGGVLLRERSTETVEYILAVAALMYADQFALADAFSAEALADARSRGSLIGFSTASTLRSRLNFRLGLLGDAQADARSALEFFTGAQWQPVAASSLIDTLVEQGRLADGRALLAGFDPDQWDPGNAHLSALFHSRGRLRCAEGDLQGGLADMLAAGDRQETWGARNPSILPWRSSAAATAWRLGDEKLAVRLADEELTLSRQCGAPRAVGISLRTMGTVTKGDKGVDLLAEAVAELEHSPAALERARAQVALGAAMRRAGRRSEARRLLRAGHDLAHGCRATVLADAARGELRQLGIRVPRPTESGVDALTPSERRVAELVATGISNRDAAQALFVTEKTIEAHLAAVFRKLGIRSRHELAAALPAGSPPDG
jgi:DNA-binding CsgD family transcriptional regulator